jgi:hypothetical protein
VWDLVWTLLGTVRSSLKTQRELALENLALRQQIGVLTVPSVVDVSASGCGTVACGFS